MTITEDELTAWERDASAPHPDYDSGTASAILRLIARVRDLETVKSEVFRVAKETKCLVINMENSDISNARGTLRLMEHRLTEWMLGKCTECGAPLGLTVGNVALCAKCAKESLP